jgi:hypothetical protein
LECKYKNRTQKFYESKDRTPSQQSLFTYTVKTNFHEDIKEVIRIRISKNRQHNGQKKKDKQRSTKHTHKAKDRVTRTPLKTGVNSGAPKG